MPEGKYGEEVAASALQDFRIASVQWYIEFEVNHRQAGFTEVKHEDIQRRFWQFLDSWFAMATQ